VLYHSEYPTAVPPLNPYSNYLFGTDLQPVILEISPDREVFSHAVPMNLHMRQYQGIVRLSPRLVLFAGGVNSARLRVSNKTLLYDMTTQVIKRVGNLNTRRYNCGVVFMNVNFVPFKNLE
jgi:hypothetical protein